MSRRSLPIFFALCLLIASCGLLGGDEETTTTTAPPTTTTTDAPVTTQASGGGAVQGQEASLLRGGGEPPPGLEDQIGYSIYYSRSCTGSLNGPSPPTEFVPPASAVARLVLGDVLYDAFVTRVEIDPTLIDRLADLRPTVDLVERTTLPPETLVTIDPNVFDSPLPTIGPLVTIDPSRIELPGVTLPPSAPSTTIVAPPPARILEVTQTSAAFFCGSGWTANAFLKTTITDPGGAIVVERFDQAGENGSAGPSWTPGLEDGVGRYTITLSDGGFTAETQFDVIAPTQPTIDVLGTSTIEAGQTVRIGLVAFPPGSETDLHFFAEDELEGWQYTGTAEDVAISELGSTIFDLPTFPDDPPGIYCVVDDPTRLFECKDVAFEIIGG